MAGSEGLWGRFSSFFREHIWEVSLTDLPRGRAIGYRVARVTYGTLRGFDQNQDTFRAAALTYFSALSIVPFLAFAFAVVKGFGAYRVLIDDTLRPYLRSTFSANEPLQRAIDEVLGFVDRTDVSNLGAAGLSFLVFTSVMLLSNIEGALNQIWGVRQGRGYLRRVTDYVSLIVIAPILILSAVTTTTAASSSSVIAFLRTSLGLGPIIDFLLRFTSLAVFAVTLMLIYMVLPNTKVRLTSALLGGIVAGVFWNIALILHVRLQVGVARYNALYSSFGAIPIFLFWIYVSWAIVMLGGELAASHQNESLARQRRRVQTLDEALREQIAVVVMARVAANFAAGREPWSVGALAEILEVPPLAVQDIVRALEQAHMLVQVEASPEPLLLPRRGLSMIRVTDVMDALRHAERGGAGGTAPISLGRTGELLRAWERERAVSPRNLTLAELAVIEDGETPPRSRELEERPS